MKTSKKPEQVEKAAPVAFTKQDAVTLYSSLRQMRDLKGVHFSYTIARNIEILRPVMDALDKAFEMSSAYKAFDDARVKLSIDHAQRDATNNPLVLGNAYVLKDPEKFNREWEKMKHKNKPLIDARNKQLKEYQELLKEPVSESFLKSLRRVKLAQIPENITVGQMEALVTIIEE